MVMSMLWGMTGVTVEEFTIDELAARTGTTVRTIRFYSENGLLPPAERRGRQAYYGAPHRIRLELVQQLQQHGYALAAIGKVIARLPENATAHDLAVRAALLTPWTPAEAETLDLHTLQERVGRSLDDREIELLVMIGAVQRGDDGTFTVRQSALDPAINLIKADLPADTFGTATKILDRHIDQMADELSVLAFGWMRSAGEHSLDRFVSLLPDLRQWALHAIVDRFTEGIDKAIQERVAELDVPGRFDAPDAHTADAHTAG